MKEEYSFMNAGELIETFKESRETFHRDGGGANYFALDLVLGDYDPGKLAKLARESGQAQALGYVCDVVKDSLPEDFRDARSKISSLAEKLYQSELNENWEHLSFTLPEWGQKLVQQRSSNPLNKKWHIYSPLDKEEMVDWFRVYRSDLMHMLQNVS